MHLTATICITRRYMSLGFKDARCCPRTCSQHLSFVQAPPHADWPATTHLWSGSSERQLSAEAEDDTICDGVQDPLTYFKKYKISHF